MTRQIAATKTAHNDNRAHLIGLLGSPAKPWLSPVIYNAAFQALGLNWQCVPLPVPSGELGEALSGLRALGFAGAELAYPYRCDALNYLDQVTPAAEMIGAVQYVATDECGRLVGDNVRWLCFLGALRALAPSLSGLCPLIIGAGEAARGVAYGLAHEGLPLTIVAQEMDRAIDLVHRLRHVLDETSFSVCRWPQDLAQIATAADLIVNATGIGAWPDADRSPWPDDLPFPSHALAFDLVAWPSETHFLCQARAGGARTMGGLLLLVYEAALAFEMWTGHSPPIGVMWDAVSEMLADAPNAFSYQQAE